MKKFITLMLVGILTAGTSVAQKVTSESRLTTIIKEEKVVVHYPMNYFVKFGLGYQFTGIETSPNGGTFNLACGFQKQTNSHGLYWGPQLGLSMMRFEKYERGTKGCNGAALYTGLMLGIKKPVGNNMTFDGHIGAGYQVSPGRLTNDVRYYDGDEKNHDTRFFHGPIWELDLGIWFDKILVGVEYRGSDLIGGIYHGTDEGLINSAALITVGYKF